MKVFISSSWDNPEQARQVSRLAESLRNSGVDTLFDQQDIKPGDSLPEFMEKAIRSSDFVLVVVTSRYAQKLKEREGGVGYESTILEGEVLRKTIPIILHSEDVKYMPEALRGKVYINLSKESESDESLKQLIATLKTPENKLSNRITSDMVINPSSVTFQLIPNQSQWLTPDFLAEKISPYLQAIENIQQITDEIRAVEHTPIRITQISQHSPIGVSLEGVSDTVQLIVDYVVPWKRKHAEKMAEYARREKQYEIEKMRIEIQETNFQSIKNKQDLEKLSIEIEKMRAETEKIRIDNEKARLELASAKINLASDILTRVTPNLPENERLSHLFRMLPMIDSLVSSDIEIQMNKLR